MKNGAFRGLYGFNLTILFSIIVIFFNFVVRLYEPYGALYTLINVCMCIGIVLTVLIVFRICQNVSDKSFEVLKQFEDYCIFKKLRGVAIKRSLKALQIIRIPCGIVYLTKEFTSEYLYGANIVSMNTLMIR